LGGAGRSPAVATTEAEEDVDGGPLRVLAEVRQQPPLKLRKVSMAGPLGVLAEVRQQPPPKLKKTSMAGPLDLYRGMYWFLQKKLLAVTSDPEGC
jgi:hypothetical protein